MIFQKKKFNKRALYNTIEQFSIKENLHKRYFTSYYRKKEDEIVFDNETIRCIITFAFNLFRWNFISIKKHTKCKYAMTSRLKTPTRTGEKYYV